MSSASRPRRGPEWQHVMTIGQVNRGQAKVVCRYCGKQYKAGATRIRAHLLGITEFGVASCTKCPTDILSQIQEIERHRQNTEVTRLIAQFSNTGRPVPKTRQFQVTHKRSFQAVQAANLDVTQLPASGLTKVPKLKQDYETVTVTKVEPNLELRIEDNPSQNIYPGNLEDENFGSINAELSDCYPNKHEANAKATSKNSQQIVDSRNGDDKNHYLESGEVDLTEGPNPTTTGQTESTADEKLTELKGVRAELQKLNDRMGRIEVLLTLVANNFVGNNRMGRNIMHNNND